MSESAEYSCYIAVEKALSQKTSDAQNDVSHEKSGNATVAQNTMGKPS